MTLFVVEKESWIDPLVETMEDKEQTHQYTVQTESGPVMALVGRLFRTEGSGYNGDLQPNEWHRRPRKCPPSIGALRQRIQNALEEADRVFYFGNPDQYGQLKFSDFLDHVSDTPEDVRRVAVQALDQSSLPDNMADPDHSPILERYAEAGFVRTKINQIMKQAIACRLHDELDWSFTNRSTAVPGRFDVAVLEHIRRQNDRGRVVGFEDLVHIRDNPSSWVREDDASFHLDGWLFRNPPNLLHGILERLERNELLGSVSDETPTITRTGRDVLEALRVDGDCITTPKKLTRTEEYIDQVARKSESAQNVIDWCAERVRSNHFIRSG